MKKQYLLLIPAIALMALSACKFNKGGKNSSDKQSESQTSQSEGSSGGSSSGGNQSSSSDSSLPADKLATFRFYLDYSHSDTPLYTMKWYINVPLGECPEEARITENMAPDPIYPHFLGYSRYSSSNDESLLWDFTTDVAPGQTAVELYGIWWGELQED